MFDVCSIMNNCWIQSLDFILANLSPTRSAHVGMISIHDAIFILHFKISSSKIRILAHIVKTDPEIIILYGLLLSSNKVVHIHPVVKVSVFGVYVIAVNVFATKS